jgi:hypothetical protein
MNLDPRLAYVKGLVSGRTDSEIVARLKKLEKIGKGQGNLMYDCLVKILREDSHQ